MCMSCLPVSNRDFFYQAVNANLDSWKRAKESCLKRYNEVYPLFKTAHEGDYEYRTGNLACRRKSPSLWFRHSYEAIECRFHFIKVHLIENLMKEAFPNLGETEMGHV